MKVSIIIAYYKNLKVLQIVLDSFKSQTYKNFEIVLAEDDDTKETIEFLKQYKNILNIIHVSQPDVGLAKNIIQNKAIVRATGEYLLFLDGDIVPYSNFIEVQVKLAKKKHILSGRRVNLPEDTTKKILDGKLSPLNVEKNYYIYSLKFMFDREVRFEQGLYFDRDGLFYGLFLKNRKRNTEILGCNFSCFKEDFVAINGFDESYGLSILGDDTDLTWRFKAAGYKLVSSKNIANVFHLWHKQRTAVEYDPTDAHKRFKEAQQENRYICNDGLNKY
ncbi:MAG: glycosyltransferase [Helicobacteraceae bacterium]|nr:glycosyltransferase [Helicobacteraceae bacterium]